MGELAALRVARAIWGKWYREDSSLMPAYQSAGEDAIKAVLDDMRAWAPKRSFGRDAGIIQDAIDAYEKDRCK